MEAMAALRQEKVTGSEPVMVRFAAATLPVLERRAEALRALEATVRQKNAPRIPAIRPKPAVAASTRPTTQP